MSRERATAAEELLSLEGVIDYGSKIASYTQRMSVEEFRGNEMVFDAVVRNLELLGEAAKRLPGEVTAALPEGDWSRTVPFGGARCACRLGSRSNKGSGARAFLERRAAAAQECAPLSAR